MINEACTTELQLSVIFFHSLNFVVTLLTVTGAGGMLTLPNIVSVGAMFASTYALTSEKCAKHEIVPLINDANAVNNRADAALVPGDFARVSKGWMLTLVDEEDGESSGGGTNTDGSYGTFTFKGEEVFPAGVCDDLNNLAGDGSVCGDSDHAISFMLGPADVIAMYSCSPPPMRYFAYDLIIDQRLTEEYPFKPGQNFGDTISSRTINTTAEDDDVFDQPALILHSADANAAQRVADAYVEHGGVDPRTISVRYVSPGTVRLYDRSAGQTWREAAPDVLSMVARLSLPESSHLEEYGLYKNTTWPVRFYFAADESKATAPVDPPLIPRFSSSIVDEVAIYSDILAELTAAVKTRFTVDGYFEGGAVGTLAHSLGVNLTSEGCYDDWDYVLGLKNNDSFVAGTRDATYGIPVCPPEGDCGMIGKMGAVAVGVVHASPHGQDAAYSSVGIDIMNYVTGQFIQTTWWMDDALEGSAARYLPDNGSPLVDQLFAVELMPKGMCAEDSKWCVELEKDAYSTTAFLMGERIYSLAATTVGPPANTTVGAQVLTFTF